MTYDAGQTTALPAMLLDVRLGFLSRAYVLTKIGFRTTIRKMTRRILPTTQERV
jgi:hypothetical protein